jgi:hypothetical protein
MDWLMSYLIEHSSGTKTVVFGMESLERRERRGCRGHGFNGVLWSRWGGQIRSLVSKLSKTQNAIAMRG